MIFRFKRKKLFNREVDPDEIFLDAKNIPQFDTQQFEGRLERPITKTTVIVLGLAFLCIGCVFLYRVGVLQIKQGQAYFDRSEKNSLKKIPIFANRGIIYDRNGVELAWNDESSDGSSFSRRSYTTAQGLAHVVGYVSYPSKDKQGNYWQTAFIGKDGIEKQYDERLSGVNGTQIVETDVQGHIESQNLLDPPQNGDNLHLSIDSKLQSSLYDSIAALANKAGYTGGSGVIMDVHTGEIVALTNYPEYEPEILSLGNDTATIKRYLNDSRHVFLDRAVSGLYAPGSIVKPFMALAALTEGVITADKQILSTGSISIPNPYAPGQNSVFKDWRANGWVDVRHAIAVSSDVYFYEVGGGFQDQKGIGIANIEKYARMFGIGEKNGVDLPAEASGVIPSPEWKAANFNGEQWRIGDTYHTVIGQYGFQVTPLEMARAVSAIANKGKLLSPHLLLGDTQKESQVTTVDIPQSIYKVVQEGMRDTVTVGIGGVLNVPYVQVALKTGTAQVGYKNQRVNSSAEGFFPYQNPKYAFVVMMENGPAGATGASTAMRSFLDWTQVNAPDYLKVD